MKKGLIVVICAILCTFLFYGIRYMKSPLLTQKALIRTYDESVYTTGYFVRDEKVYTAQRSGTVYNHYSDGMRASKGMVISTIYDGKVSEEQFQELNTIDKKIEKTRQTALTVNFAEDDANLENRIGKYKEEITDAAIQDDIGAVISYKDAIKTLRSGSSSATVPEVIAMLEQQKIIVEGKIGGEKQEIIAEQSGVFSTVLDGMEHILTPEKVMEYGVADFNDIKPVSARTSNQTVNEGDSICKVVNNHKWYVVCAVASERLAEKKLGSSVTMRFDNIPGIEVSGKIKSISEPSDGKNVVMIESTQYVEGAYSMRSSKMQLIFKSYTGFKVPISSIRIQDGVKGVMARRNNAEKFYPCDIIYTNETAEYVIIRTPQDSRLKLEDVDEFVIGER